MKLLLLHAASFVPEPIADALKSAGVITRVVGAPKDLAVSDHATVMVLDPGARPIFPLDRLRSFVNSGGAIVALGAADERDLPEQLPDELLAAFAPHGASTRQLLVAIRTAYREAIARGETAQA